MAKKNWLALAFAPALALTMVVGMACGGDDDDDDTAADTPDVTQPAGSTQQATQPAGSATSAAEEIPAGAPEVDQNNLAFKPTTLTVKAGEKVYFKNSESAIHTVDIEGKNESGTMRKGDVFVYTFDKPGSYDITCEYHPQMKAKITVE